MMEIVGQATKYGFAGSFTAIGGSLYAAVVSPDIIPVISAMGLGVVGLGWSIYSAGRDRRVSTLVQEIGQLQEIMDERSTRNRSEIASIRADLAASEDERRKLNIENYRLAGKLARIEGSMPTPDPEARRP